MHRFVIERNIPGASKLTAQELKDIAARSNAAIAALGKPYTWVESFVAGDKFYCIHEADSAEDIIAHARTGRFPADLVSEVSATIGPDTAKAEAA
jgi:hypothetical protein